MLNTSDSGGGYNTVQNSRDNRRISHENLIDAMSPNPTSEPPNTSLTRPSPATEVYEEFFSGTLPCPTCRGSGRIPRDQENQLVALIPMRDSRLKPRRTALYVSLAVVVCIIIGGLLLFFLLPRSIMLSSDIKTIVPLSANVSILQQYVRLKIRNEYNISNHNFFPVDVTKMNVRVLFDDKSMVDVTNNTVVHVGMRAVALYSMDFEINFTGESGYLAYFCKIGSDHSILMPFQASLSTSYYGHSEEVLIEYIQRVQCSESTTLEFPWSEG